MNAMQIEKYCRELNPYGWGIQCCPSEENVEQI